MPTGAKIEAKTPALWRLLPKVVLTLALVAGLGAAYLVVSGQVVSGQSLAREQNAGRLEVYGSIPEFQFTQQDGAAFTKHDILGQISIANFIFTRCQTVCPVFTMKMRRVAEQTHRDIQLLSFSVDPSYDTPERLAQYAAEHRADTTRWHFLTGEEEAVKDTVEGALKISMERQDTTENGVPDIIHGTHFVLFDRRGQIRGYYNSDDADRIAALLADAEALRTEALQSKALRTHARPAPPSK